MFSNTPTVTIIIIALATIVIIAGVFPEESLSETTHHKSSSLLPAPSSSSSASQTNSSNVGSNIGTNKVVMINFDDGWKSQFLYAKPILDHYGFKASFFIPCAKMEIDPKWMTWRQITALKNDGMDIESHTMTHAHLTKLLSTPARLNYEIGQSKQCLADHGFNTTIFGYPVNLGSDIPSIVNLVARYYDFARTGIYPLMFLNCNGFKGEPPQADCRTYSDDGKLTFANRYDIRCESFSHIDSNHNYTPDQVFPQFVDRMNSQIPYNSNGRINAIPIMVYHNLTYNMQEYSESNSTITVPLFAQEMKYLHDNGFKVLVLNQFGYDPNSNVFYITNNVTGHSGIGATTTTTTSTTTVRRVGFR